MNVRELKMNLYRPIALSVFVEAHRLTARNAIATARRMKELGHGPGWYLQAVRAARLANQAAVREQAAARARCWPDAGVQS